MEIFGILSFMGFTIGLISAVDAFVSKSSVLQKTNTFLLFSSIAFIQLEWSVWFIGQDNIFPYLQFINIPLNLLIGPLLYVYLTTILNDYWKMKLVYFIPFLPSILSFFIFIPYIFFNSTEQLMIKLLIDNNTYLHPYVLLIKIFRVFIFIQTNFYIILFIYKTRIIYTLKSVNREPLVLHILLINLLAFSFLFIGLISELFLSVEMYSISFKIISSLILFLQVYLHLILRAYPQSAFKVKKEIKKVKYENSNLKNVDTEALMEQFLILFKEDKIYQNEGIRLQDVARKLDIGNHKISQFINEAFELSFYDILNKYRIEEAEELLIKEPKKTVLNIALQVGFTNVSTFYSAFKKKWNIAPNEYRSKFLNKHRSS